MLGSGVHYSEEEWVRYTRDLETSVSSLPQVFMETCRQTEILMGTLEGRVDALHATMQQSMSMCSENSQRVQQVQQECEIIRKDFQDLTTKVAFSFDQVKDALARVESETQVSREHGQHTLANAESQSQSDDRSAEHIAQLEKSLQARMAQLREQNHTELAELHAKVERLSESTQCMGEMLQARAESVHTELRCLQEAVPARPPPLVEVSSLVAQLQSFQERQAQFERHVQDSMSQQVSQLRMEVSQSPPHTLCKSWWYAWRARPRKFVT